MSEIDYAARVQRGAALLDEKWPTWAQDINLDMLNIQSATHCVTAQFSGFHGKGHDYSSGQTMLGLNVDAYLEHGFNAECGMASEYIALNALWRGLIQERRAQAQPEASER